MAVSPELILRRVDRERRGGRSRSGVRCGGGGRGGACCRCSRGVGGGAPRLLRPPKRPAAGALAAVSDAAAEAATGAEASSARAAPIPPASSEPAISKDINNLRIFRFPLVAICVAIFWCYRASAPVSPVRIRMTCSIGVTKILPSPILPVRAARSSASMA